MKKLLLIAFLFFYSGSASAGPCDGEIPGKDNGATWCSNGDVGTIAADVTLNRGTNRVLIPSHNNTITNYGNITGTHNYVIDTASASGGDNLVINNKSTGFIRSNKSRTIWLKDVQGEIEINNEGEIYALTYCAICSTNNRGSITVTNSGTIHTGTTDPETGVEVYNSAIGFTSPGTGASYTINNSGTIKSVGDNLAGIYVEDVANATIINSGTIQGHGTRRAINIQDHGTETGTTIKLSGAPIFTNGIELGKTVTNIVLQSDITANVTVNIYNYDSDLTITNQMASNDTYSITEEDLDSDGTADDGILTILLGEDLGVTQTNQKYRAENVLTKLRGLFSASHYVGGKWSDYCTTVDSEKVDSELDEVCNQRFAKVFHSYQKRDGIYDGTISGAVGVLSPINWKGFPITSNIFVGYADQKGDFNNGEYLGGDNYVLGFKNVYERKGFRASFTPIIGINDLGVTDYDSDEPQNISTDFLSEFAAVNGKIKKKVITGENRSLSISVEGTYGVQKFPKYISKFTNGDLTVDESIEQLLSGGFEVSYMENLPGHFVIKPYFGVNLNRNLNDQIKITSDSNNTNVTNSGQETWSGYYAGVNFTKEVKGTDFDLDLMYGNEDGLINQIAAISLTKSFGKAKTVAFKKQPDFPKVDESLTTQDYGKDIKELEKLRNLTQKLKAENTALKAQNEKLKLLAEKALQQNQAKEKLVVELLKENEKLKLNNQIFKNRILENENAQLKQSIEHDSNKPKDKFALIVFLIIYILTVLGLTSFVASIYNRIRFRMATN